MDDLRVFKSICGAASALPTYRAVLVTLFLKMFQKMLNSNAFFLCYLSMFIYAVVHNASLPQLKKKLECNCIIMRQIGEASYSLHKFPLISKSGHIRKLISESSNAVADVPLIELIDVSGGSETFELAAKFCYWINFEISVESITMLRCVAKYLEMTEDYSDRNMVGRTDSYLNEVALKSMSGAISILHTSETLLPIAKKAKLVSRCINAIACLHSFPRRVTLVHLVEVMVVAMKER
ncbi:putative chromatin remodeling & transcription regulator BTB-POZ family [Medicago truncatula]|uniref:Putative chromatin remodeling & transcription regulator BTB-POZ family n=2 Tax=Medicago truncatula TaxID=3880 RepID=A0A396K278_MEDTR|nr:putative chromatin remodeling & transcription regulator BTB-POZ family [Medicago truncatula]